MKKNSRSATPVQHEKGFFALAGEAFHVLGEEIIEGKDKVLAATTEKIGSVKEAIQKIVHKKAAPAGHTAKKAVKKAALKTAKKVSPAKKKG